MRHFIYFILTGSILALSFQVSCKESLNLAVMTDWRPYLYTNQQGEATGEDLQLLKQTLKRIGYDLNTLRLPEQRMAREFVQGQIDVILGAAFTKEREVQNFYSIPYRKEIIVFGYKHSRHPQFSSANITDLLQQDYLVAVNKSGWYGEAFQRGALDVYNRNLIHAEGTLRRMQLLKMNRIDAVVGDEKVLKTAALELGVEDFVMAEQVIHETQVHFLFSRNRVDEAFMQRFNEALIVQQTVEEL